MCGMIYCMGCRRRMFPLLVAFGMAITISYRVLSYNESIRRPFLLRYGPDYTQLLPNTENISSISSETWTIYTHYEQQYDVRIIVITYKRHQSLDRLLRSLNDAEYINDSVKLEVWIDRSQNGSVDKQTVRTARSFKFNHGVYEVIRHPTHVGIVGQWLSTWRVSHNGKEIMVILEDDLTVSPYFYKYLKLVHAKYDHLPEVNGYALQGVSIKHDVNSYGGELQGPENDTVYLYPVIGTWGFSPSPKNWEAFLTWFQNKYKITSFQPYVKGNVVTVWYDEFRRAGKDNNVWSIWHIYYAWENKEYTLYPNFKGHQGLTVNWKEAGLHYSGQGQGQVKASNEMLTSWKPEYEILPDRPVKLNIAGLTDSQR